MKAIALTLLLVAALALAGCEGMTQEPVVVDPGTELGADADTEIVEEDVIEEDVIEEDVIEEEVVEEEVVEEEVVEEEVVEEEVVEPVDAATAGSGLGIEGIPSGTYARGYALIDWNFENIDGGVSGEIEDFYFDLETGQIPFVDIEYGGFLDIGDTEVVVPLNAFSWGLDDDLVLNFDETVLENFPDLGDDWPDVTQVGWDDEVDNFWGGLGYEVAPEIADAGGPIVKAEDLRGFALVDLGTLGAGTIQDFLVDLGEARVRYVMVGFGTGATGINDAYILPLEIFELEGVTDTLGQELLFDADVTQEMLLTAPRFDPVIFGQGDIYGPGWNEIVDEYWQPHLEALD